MKLLLNSETLSERKIRNLDLFNVSALKRSGSCVTEIKFYDRLKALDRLFEIGKAETCPAEGFIEALSRTALTERDDGDCPCEDDE